MTDIEWSLENVVGLIALVVFLLTADYDAAGHALKEGAKKAGCGVAKVVTLNQWHCEPAKENGK